MATSPLCSVRECSKPAIKRGFCNAHYQRWRTHGDAECGRTSLGQPVDWLQAHMRHQNGECLIWPFARFRSGYAHVIYEGVHMFASRAMCMLAHGEPPSPIHQAAHSCGKGAEGCVNPKHLRWKTPKENCADTLVHGTRARGQRLGRSGLSESDVLQIRALRGKLLQREIAETFGVDTVTVCNIQRRKTWDWLE